MPVTAEYVRQIFNGLEEGDGSSFFDHVDDKVDWIVELEQKSSDFLDTGTELVNPNFAAMAAAAGIKGIRIEDPAEVDEKPAEGLAYPGLVLVDAVVNRMELAMPPQITAEMA